MKSKINNYIILLSLIFWVSCVKSTPDSDSAIVPKGTAVKLEAISDGSEKIAVHYYDEQENWIYNNVNTGWSYSFNTTKDDQSINFIISSNVSKIIGRIYINGVLKKEGKNGTGATLAYP